MELTGNPFVDTGLTTLAVLAGKESVNDLDFEAIAAVFGNGDQLARQNQSLKCFTMVFGTNGPLTQPAYKKSGKNEEIYKSIVGQLLEISRTEGQSGPRCDLTGRITNLDFQAVCANALSQAGVPVPDRKWLGRDWVPLGGSLGNDAQSLPVASRPLHVSALALFALQYLPLGVYLFKGKLSCYQSTEEELSYAWVKNIVERNLERLSLGQSEILGKGMGTAGAFDLLMNCFENLSYKPGTQALLWLFSNSGAGADCAIEEMPDTALAFIAKAASASYNSEVRQLIANEPKDSRLQMFECVRAARDYPGLYTYKKQAGASPEFYEFYQREIRGATQEGLNVARKLAQLILQEDPRRRKEIQKPEFIRSQSGRSLIRKYIIAHLTTEEYHKLFPSERHPIRTSTAAWEQLRYYLTTPHPDARPIEPPGNVMKTTHPKIVQIAETYRDIEPRKIKDLLNRMAMRKIGVRWLQDKFCRLAQEHKDWNLGDWDEFVCDEDGKIVAFELLFQLRLYLSNLYREVTANGKGEAA